MGNIGCPAKVRSAEFTPSGPDPAGGSRVKRDVAIDYLRGGVIVSVVAHHSALAYTTFSHYNPVHYEKSTAPVVDTVRFPPLDVLVSWNDIFFMSLMFFISGLFVAPSIIRKGAGRFLADRAKRLGIPFIIAITFLSPIAFYPSWLLSDSAGREFFLGYFFTNDVWSPGPAWFLSVLLVFCIIAAGAYHFMPELMKRFSWSAGSAGGLVIVVVAVNMMATIPVHLFLAHSEWFRLAGPLHFPASRSLLYFAWFLLGVAMGGAGQERSLSRENLRWWPLWLIIGALGYAVHAAFLSGKYLQDGPAWEIKLILSTAFTLCCSFTSLAALGLARSLFRTSWSVAGHFSENAYGVYIFHYAFVIWLQFGLLTQPMSAVVKFLVTFPVALTASWSLTALLRRTPAKKIL